MSSGLTPTLALIRELAAWRELAAQKRNLPRNRLVRDEARTRAEFFALVGCHP